MSTAAHQRHAAKFYDSDQSLCSTVADFLSAGLVSGDPALVIATSVHAAMIEEALGNRLIDVLRARRGGDLVMLDAEEMLGTFMSGGLPDADLFTEHVGAIFQQILRGRGNAVIRAYGEMVDVLWKQGNSEGAIALEILWNKLALRHAFSLLCGYSMGNFFKQAEQFHDICRLHTHVFDPDQSAVYAPAARP
jgi:hypothetical protein